MIKAAWSTMALTEDLLLQLSKYIGRIQRSRTLHKYSKFNVRAQSIDETLGIVKGVRMRSIGSKLIQESREVRNVIGNWAGLVDMEEAPNENLMFIAAKAIKDQLGKGLPETSSELGFNRFLPPGSILFTVHRSNPNPFELFDRVKIKVIFTILKPSFRIGALEYRKMDLRKFAGRAPATTALIS
jgi:hypothetical protein